MNRAFLNEGWRTVVAATTIAAFFATTPALAQEPTDPPPPPPGAAPTPPAPPPPSDPNAPPPPGYGQPPPPGYGQPPPPGYGQPPPPGYGQPPPPGYDQPGYGPPPRDDSNLPRVINNWEEGDPIPPGYVERGRIRKGLVIGGSVTLGTLWLISVLSASFAYSIESVDGIDGDTGSVSKNDWIPLFIPVVGPFVTMGTVKAEGAGIALLAIDGVAQAGGLAMLIAGIVAERKVLVRDYETGFDMTITPSIGLGHTGLGVTGHF